MKRYSVLAALVLSCLMVGCQSSSRKPEAHFFTSAQDHTQLQAFADRQAAAAAQQDATLYPTHFTGPRLNSLGQQKLELMLNGPACGRPTKLFLAGNADTTAHRLAVRKYLASHGSKPGQFTLVAGPNPDSFTLARKSLSDLDSLNSTSGSSNTSTAAPAGTSPGAMTSALSGN